jgi:hypothetical protein
MYKEEALRVLSAILLDYPNHRKLSNGLMLSESETHNLFVGLVTQSHESVDVRIAVEYHIPDMPIELSKKKIKQLNKLNKKFFMPKGFTLVVTQDRPGVCRSFLAITIAHQISRQEFKELHDQATMLAMFAFKAVSDLTD